MSSRIGPPVRMPGPPLQTQLDRIESSNHRIESKLDALIAALAEDEEAVGRTTLDEPEGIAQTVMRGLDG